MLWSAMAITISEALNRPTRKLDLKTTLLALRGVISLLMFCFLAFNPNLEGVSLTYPMLMVGLYIASDLGLIWVRTAVFDDAFFQSGLLLFDVAVISGIIYACQGFDSDLYLIYFVVLLMSGMQMRIWQSLLTGLVASVVYVTLWQRANPGSDIWDANILLRLPFFYIVALSAAFFAQQSHEREERAKEAASNEEKAKLETVFSQMKDGAVLTDERGRIVLSNASARDFLGLQENGGTLSGLPHMRVEPSFASLLETAQPAAAFEIVRSEHKTLILAGTASRLHFDAVGDTAAWNGRLFVFRDVTVERGEERLKRSFLSLISHKLRTPMTVILGFIQMLINNESAPDAAAVRRKSYDSIKTQALKLSGLINKLLDFITLQASDPLQFEPKPFVLAEAAREAVDELGEWLPGQGAALDDRLPAGLKVGGEREQVERLFKNLIENAVKFNSKPAKKVLLQAEAKGDWVEVRVTDDGRGIPPEDLERIAAKFYQSEPTFTGNIEGWGLGLAVVKLIVERHGGTFAISSQLSKGTVVSFTLPKA